MGRWASSEGLPYPLGASWIEAERAWNFALYSKHARRVTLLLYREGGEGDLEAPLAEIELPYLSHKSGRVWHCRVPEAEIAGARYYAYRVEGPEPEGPFEHHTFDPEKVLLDPYARSVYFPPGFSRAAACRLGSNAGRAPLGLLDGVRQPFDWGLDPRPRHEADLVIYELHVRGFTVSPTSGVAAERRGTFEGLVEKIPYLLELGVTAVELMPILQFDPQEGNYWGYMPINFFSPHHGYAASCATCDQHNELKRTVRALHEAGIEVILDVVYNHTGEGGLDGPTYSFKGIDNSTYYMLSGNPQAPYQNFSGTGNTLHCANSQVRGMILDSLRYWAKEVHVDGFRFDLASIFARNSDGSLNTGEPPIFGQIGSDPDLAGVRLIAEPWDVAANQLGRAFAGSDWRQWNDRFRDDVRRFVRGDGGMVAALMERLYGSDDAFPDTLRDAYHPWQSVNHVTSHDGFTLYDLVAYDRRRNEANGHGNTDGPKENWSWNCGWEGDDGVPAAVVALRKRQAKNFCCLLLLANGTPMIGMGDEMLRTQRGNSNPYNQDDETTWVDWRRLAEHRDVFEFWKGMIAFRKTHPSIARSRFWRGDVRWHGVGREPDLAPGSHTLAYFLDGSSQGDDDLYVLANAWWKPLAFTVQEGRPGEWRRAVDTSRESPGDLPDPAAEEPLASLEIELAPRSVVVLVR